MALGGHDGGYRVSDMVVIAYDIFYSPIGRRTGFISAGVTLVLH